MKRSGILYRDIAEDIKTKIFHDGYPVGSMVPTENELAAQYAVSKITVRNAVKILVAEGYLKKQSGKGTFVISNRPFNHLAQAASFSSILESGGHQVTKRVLAVALAKESERPEPLRNVQEEVTKVTRVHDMDGRPYVYTEHFLRAPLASFATKNLANHSLYQVLLEADVTIHRFEDTMTVGQLSEAAARTLMIEEPTALCRVRQGFDAAGALNEYSVAYYNTKIHPYQMQYEV